jgi:hypothetical protein
MSVAHEGPFKRPPSANPHFLSHQVSEAAPAELRRDLPLRVRRPQDAVRRALRLRLQGRLRVAGPHPQGVHHARCRFLKVFGGIYFSHIRTVTVHINITALYPKSTTTHDCSNWKCMSRRRNAKANDSIRHGTPWIKCSPSSTRDWWRGALQQWPSFPTWQCWELVLERRRIIKTQQTYTLARDSNPGSSGL